MSRKLLLAAALAASLFGAAEARFPHGSAPAVQFVSQLKIGGGGWTTRCVAPANGTRRCRTDTYGAFQWDSVGQIWSQLIIQSKLPAADFGYFPATGTSQVGQGGGGSCEIAADTVNSGATFYVWFANKIFVSTDNGATLKNTGFTSTGGCFPNGHYRQNGAKMAVDPWNSDHVLTGTDIDGLFETTNGTNVGGATFTHITAVPNAVADNRGCTAQPLGGQGDCFPGYNIVFDPASAHNCRGTLTCNVYVFAYTNPAGTPTGKLWKTTDGGTNWTATTSGPTTMADLQIAAGVVWATDDPLGDGNGGNLWKFASGAWTQITGATPALWACGPTSGNDTCHSIAINPASSAKMALSTPAGNLSYSANSGVAWTGVLGQTLSSPTIPWIALAGGIGFMSSGNIVYDPTLTDTLLEGAGLGPWLTTTTGLTGASTVAWVSSMVGTEQLVAQDVIAPNGVAVVGVEDKSSFYLGSPNSYPADGNNTFQDAIGLSVTYALDYAATNKNFMVQLNTPSSGSSGDNSGSSSDGGQNWTPYNTFYSTVLGTAISNCSPNSNQPIFDLSAAVGNQTTTGLTTWAAGAGTMLKVIAKGQFLQPFFAPITKIDSTHFQLSGSLNCSNFLTTAAQSFQLIASTAPLSNYNGQLFISNVANNGSGAIRVTFAASVSAVIDRNMVCITGVGGVTAANGCWEASNSTANTTDLRGSTFSGAYTANTGVATTTIPDGGYVAAASTTNIAEWASQNDHPYCTTDGGQTWAQLTMASEPIPARITNAAWAVTGIGQVTFTTGTATNLQVGETFNVSSVSPSGYNHSGSGSNYIAISGTTGTTVVGQLASGATLANPGAYSSGGVVSPQEPGWSFALYTFSHAAAADRVTPNTFYAYNYLRGVYKFTNCGSGSIVSNGGTPTSGFFPSSGVTTSLKSVPGYAGHLFFTAGAQGVTNHPSNTNLYRSTDAGATWQAIATVAEPIKINCDGAIAPGSDYPTCYMDGWVSNVYGIWRTTATAAQWASGAGTGTSVVWTKVSDYPLGSMDGPVALSGDGAVWNKWYIGFGGSGFAYGQQN